MSLGPVHAARRLICLGCEFYDPEEGRCNDVDADPTPYGSDSDKVALAPWVMRLECEVWDEKEGPEKEIAHDAPQQ